jgi:hypothetical protein
MPQVDPTSNIEPTLLSSNASRHKRVLLRAAFMSGFAVLLVLAAIPARDFSRALNELEAGNSGAHHDYLTRERMLCKIRDSMYESGNLLCAYTLTDASLETRESYAAQLQDIRNHATAVIDSCLRQSPANLQVPVRNLARELENYWLVANHSLNPEMGKQDQALLHRTALDRRAALLGVAGEVSRVNEVQLRLAQAEISNTFAKSRARLQNFSALAIGIILLLAIANIRYVSRLEQNADEKYIETLRYRHELKELSTSPTLTQEDQRRTVSRELHAELTQVLGALLTHVQDLLDDPRTSGYARTGLQKIRALAEDAIRKPPKNTLLLRDCAMSPAFKADTPNEGVDLQKER